MFERVELEKGDSFEFRLCLLSEEKNCFSLCYMAREVHFLYFLVHISSC